GAGKGGGIPGRRPRAGGDHVASRARAGANLVGRADPARPAPGNRARVKAVILAAGQGTRLRPLTDDRPKCMVELGGVPLLHRQLAALLQAGVTDVSVVVGYHAAPGWGPGTTVVA